MTTDILEDGGITDDVRKTKRYKVLQNSWISCYRIKTAVTVLLVPSDVIHDTYRLDLIPVIHNCDVRTDRLYVFKRYLTLLKVLNKFGYSETDSYRFHSSDRVINV